MSGESDLIAEAVNNQQGGSSPGTYYTGSPLGGFGGGTYNPGEPYTPHYLSQASGKHSATNNQAALARAEYEDYKQRFVPIENELLGQIGDRSVYAENVNRGVNADRKSVV